MGAGHLPGPYRQPLWLPWFDFFFFSERTEQLLLKGFKRVLHVEVGTQGLEQGCAPDYTPQPTLFYNEQHREPGLQARDCPPRCPVRLSTQLSRRPAVLQDQPGLPSVTKVLAQEKKGLEIKRVWGV